MSLADLPLLIEPADLAAHLTDTQLILVDVCQAERFAQGHIPHAQLVTPPQTQAQHPPKGYAPTAVELEQLFSQLGHHPDAHYVVYDDEGGGWAGRFIWLLDLIGHKHYHYLNGGWHAWLQEQREVTTDYQPRPATETKIQLTHEPFSVTTEQLISALEQSNTRIWDARSLAEFSGDKALAQRAGHIPNAICFEWTKAMDINNSLRIRQDMQQVLEQLGFLAEHTVITHCQTHHRSGFTYLVGKIFGLNIKAYPGSWSEWGNRTDTPIEI
ncbi:rhodanese-like domain-containing protein [Pseudomonas sp. F1_0610]|uniref:rhodanese-like domain-containing protein n=1 Tax=Pseudomonas sp. F1_0610 TaxID=3114284 RepID=UPI0039C13FBC